MVILTHEAFFMLLLLYYHGLSQVQPQHVFFIASQALQFTPISCNPVVSKSLADKFLL